MKKSWIVTYYGPKGFNSWIKVNYEDLGNRSIKEYAELIKGERELWYTIR